MKKFFCSIGILAILFSATCYAQKCKRFFTYSSTTVDIKGVTMSLKKAGIPVDVGIGEIKIDPKYTVAVERLQQLDLGQFALCGQIKGLSKRSSLREELERKRSEAYTKMIDIASDPARYNQQ